MISMIWATTTLALLFAITAAAPGYAFADSPIQPPVPDWANKEMPVPYDAVLYETTENLSLKALKRERRKASSSLVGFARLGGALCPEALVMAVEPTAKFCTLNATGSDNISLITGFGTFTGDVEVTVQEVLKGKITPDSPEVVVATGRFTGKMDFSPAIVDGVPLGSVDGFVSLGKFSKRVPFHGVFRLPFLFAPFALANNCDENAPLYLTDPEKFGIPSTFGVSCVADNEMAIGYPTVRFEIFFSF
jgi:hypothetical protein